MQYDAVDQTGQVSVRVCGSQTVRALVSHTLLVWDGGVFSPEAKAVLTERGKFVLEHGRTPEPEFGG